MRGILYSEVSQVCTLAKVQVSFMLFASIPCCVWTCVTCLMQFCKCVTVPIQNVCKELDTVAELVKDNSPAVNWEQNDFIHLLHTVWVWKCFFIYQTEMMTLYNVKPRWLTLAPSCWSGCQGCYQNQYSDDTKKTFFKTIDPLFISLSLHGKHNNCEWKIWIPATDFLQTAPIESNMPPSGSPVFK